MRKRLPVIIAYVALLALSLPVPLLHHFQTDRVVESLRPVIKLNDGTYSPTLLPVTTLFLRWLRHFVMAAAAGLFLCFGGLFAEVSTIRHHLRLGYLSVRLYYFLCSICHIFPWS